MQIIVRHFFISIATLLLNVHSQAHNYHEHRRLGNLAFQRAISRLNWEDLQQHLRLQYDSTQQHWYFPQLSRQPNQVSYGTLNALAGDHAGSPMQLIDNLRYSYSELNRIVMLQDEYGRQFFTNAHNGKLYKTDKTYGTLALTNLDHFYRYGKSLTYHLAGVDRKLIEQLLNPSREEDAMQALERTNAIEAYVSLHAAAVQLAQEAGLAIRANAPEKGETLLFYALVFNAFADHFLQDSFAAGHLIVKRKVTTSVTNNKAMHDFYNHVGLEVVNLRGEVWKTNGDDETFLPDPTWEEDIRYADIAAQPEDSLFKVQQVVTAVGLSIGEVFDSFLRATAGNGNALLARIPAGDEGAEVKEKFYLNTFAALSYLPVPFDSKLEKYGFEGQQLKTLQAVNQIPFYRSYIRSRVSHSLTLGTRRRLYNLNGKDEPDIIPLELRYRVGLNGYKYHDRKRKAGTFDHWKGVTAAYMFGLQPVYNEQRTELLELNTAHQAKIGYNQITDFWITNNSFIGFHRFIETGVDFRGGKAAWLVSPSVGLQLFPFAAGRHKTAGSKAAVLLLRLLLGQKFLFSYQFITGGRSQFYINSEFDITF
jgi:hypothetical protein